MTLWLSLHGISSDPGKVEEDDDDNDDEEEEEEEGADEREEEADIAHDNNEEVVVVDKGVGNNNGMVVEFESCVGSVVSISSITLSEIIVSVFSVN